LVAKVGFNAAMRPLILHPRPGEEHHEIGSVRKVNAFTDGRLFYKLVDFYTRPNFFSCDRSEATSSLFFNSSFLFPTAIVFPPSLSLLALVMIFKISLFAFFGIVAAFETNGA
jgi:hypothetical protein